MVAPVFSSSLSSEARRRSDILIGQVCRHIASQGGWISFADYMEQVLYAPFLGYYSGAAVKFGAQGDFVTAPEISSLYGRTWAQALLPLMKQTGTHILELGAGSGKMARDVLDELAACGIAVDRYDILELSPDLRQRQQQVLDGYSIVHWLSALPERFEGIVIANEVLDAIPVHLIVKQEMGWYEWGVCHEKGRFVMRTRPADPELLQAIAFQIPNQDTLPEGYVTEIHTRACGLIRKLADLLLAGTGGAILLADYGFPAHEYYHPDRTGGTWICHYRHHVHDDPFYLPGLQDITAHVDFTAIARAATESGLDILCYANQANFLIGAGILACRETVLGAGDAMSSPIDVRAVQTFLSPTEMGELFKVLVLGHHIVPPDFMSDIDRSGRLSV